MQRTFVDDVCVATHSIYFPQVQAACIPLFMAHKDVVVQAQTGSGKTLSFVIPAFEALLRRKTQLQKYQVGILIISPTQELAEQIFDVASLFIARAKGLTIQLVTGASEPRESQRQFIARGAHVIVATPGRLVSMLRHTQQLDFRELEFLILDEADRLLDMGFHAQVTKILKHMPKLRRTGLFSATQTRELSALVKAGLRNPVTINVAVTKKSTGKSQKASTLPKTLQNFYAIVNARDKLAFLIDFLSKRKTEKVIVFFLTCACVDYFARVVNELGGGAQAVPLHGKMPSKKRNSMFKKFQTAEKGAMFCTDVAARGIDLPDVDWIVQFDPPQSPSFYVHRVGRTSRAGREGSAVMILMPHEHGLVDFLATKRVPMQRMRTGYLGVISADVEQIIDENDSKSAPNKTAQLGRTAERAILSQVHSAAQADRAVMELGQRSFVSFVRAYKEHELRFTLVFRELPFARIAEGYGLLFFPKMPDLKHLRINFKRPLSVSAKNIKYKDKRREAQRLKTMAARRVKNEGEREAREAEQAARAKAKKKAKPKRRRKRVHQEMKAEWEELQNEVRLMKQLKRGKISKAEFLKAVGEKDLMGEEN